MLLHIHTTYIMFKQVGNLWEAMTKCYVVGGSFQNVGCQTIDIGMTTLIVTFWVNYKCKQRINTAMQQISFYVDIFITVEGCQN